MTVDSPPYKLGATLVGQNDTYFRVWAPKHQRVAVEVREPDGNVRRHDLQRDDGGYFGGLVSNVAANTRYRYLLDGSLSRPDPASRFQPDGVHGDSQVIDIAAFGWTDRAWHGIAKRDLIIYELHIGAFTAEGTFRAAIGRLAELQQLGVTAIEIMPVAQTPGKWNWGYDGVDLFATRNTYGTPDDFKALVDACHAVGIAVILDVVYNHLGPEGNYLGDFGPYFSRKHTTQWGEAFNFDGRRSEYARQFVIDNALYWLDEYHLDGLRLDAVHFMFDDSDTHILTSIRHAVTDFEGKAARHIHLIAEANVYDDSILTKDESSYNAIWCDCLLHAIYSHGVPGLRLTPRTYTGSADIAETLEHAHLYSMPNVARVSRGQPGTSPDVDKSYMESLVIALQTHDSVGNHPHGKRLHQLTSVEFQKAAAALVLLYPSIPLLFMGEEYATTATFPFFVDFEDAKLRGIVDRGRASEYPQHEWNGALSPSDPRAFQVAKCDDVTGQDLDVFEWYKCLLWFRKRGIADGWLTPQRLTTAYDPTFTLFSLAYRMDSKNAIELHVRLATDGRQEVATIPVVGRILLNSKQNSHPEPSVPSVELESLHAVVIWKTSD